MPKAGHSRYRELLTGINRNNATIHGEGGLTCEKESDKLMTNPVQLVPTFLRHRVNAMMPFEAVKAAVDTE